jgi:hypothetical protein
MKQNGFKIFLLILTMMALSIVPAVFGDEQTVDLESRILDSFDGDSGYDWRVVASKFATSNDEGTFPQINLIQSWPMALFGANREGRDLRILGVHGKFDRQGYNWIDVYPVAAGDTGNGDEGPAAVEIPIPGRAHYLDVWAWGANFDYYIEAYVRDYRGVVHMINMGSIAYQGWKNLRATIPNIIPQGKRILPRLASLTFVKFRIWTQPREQVRDFYVYFDQLKVLTDMFESIFDGDELADAERVQELWNAGSEN